MSKALARKGEAVGSSLFELEEQHRALLDTQDLVPEEQREAFAQDLWKAGDQGRAKVDNYSRLIWHFQAQAAAAKRESEKLTARQKFYERAIERVRGFLRYAMESPGQIAAGEYRQLAGNFFGFRLQRGKPKVKVRDESIIPDHYRRVTITMNSVNWKELIAQNPHLQVDGVCDAKTEVMVSWIEDALRSRIPVPGAEWEEVYSLQEN